MPVLTRGKEVLRYAGAATAAAPYVRELATDPELHEGFRGALHVLARISDEMAADERLRDRLFSRVGDDEAAAAARARKLRRRRYVRWGLLGAGVIVAVTVTAGVLLHPRSRQRITQTLGGARQGVASVAGRFRPAQSEPETAAPGDDQARAAA